MKTGSYIFYQLSRASGFVLCTLLTFCFSCAGHHDDDHDNHEEEEIHSHEGAVMIEPEKAAEFGIVTEKVTPSPFAAVVKVSGMIEPAQSEIMTITARKSGILTLNPEVTAGMKVNAGFRIATITPAGIEGGDVNAAAHSNLQAAKKELDRLSTLYKEGLVTAAAYNEAERAYKESLALTSGSVKGGSVSETSPFQGYITQLPVASGAFVRAGDPIAVVSKSSRLTLRADVPARHRDFVSTVISANFRPEYSDTAYSIAELDGRLISAGTATATEAGFLPVSFSFDNNGEIQPGCFAEVFLLGNRREEVLSVPLTALIEMQGNKYLYEVHDGHAYEKKLVKTGNSDGSRIEILEGLEPGETIVAKGANVVRMAETSAVAPPSHNHNH